MGQLPVGLMFVLEQGDDHRCPKSGLSVSVGQLPVGLMFTIERRDDHRRTESGR